MEILLKDWLLGWDEQSELPSLRTGAAKNFTAITVPHNVQQMAFSDQEELFYGTNLEQISWTQEKAWIYKTCAQVTKLPQKRYFLEFAGVDYYCEFYVNGRHVKTHEGMFGGITLDVTELLHNGENQIWCIFFLSAEMRERSKRHFRMKCQNSYGWDAAPNMLTMGLWDQVTLVEKDPCHICDYHICAEVSHDDTFITIKLERAGNQDGDQLRVLFGNVEHYFTLENKEQTFVRFAVQEPIFWYPHNIGEPYLYDVTLELQNSDGLQCDRLQTRYGIRSLKMTHCATQNESDKPLRMNINGTPVFLKGVNMVPLEVFPARLDEKRYGAFLTRLKEGGINLVRVWGGGLLEKDSFYEACDREGVLVWQDFPQCCENPPDEDTYLELLKDQAERIIRKLRNHCSVAVYAGGNELYVDWSRLKDESERAVRLTKEIEHLVEPFDYETFMAGARQYDEPALKLLDELCERLDGTRPYHISSPLEGEGEVHGPWGYDLQKGDQRYQTYPGTFYQFWNNYNAVLFSESGCSGMANLEQYRKIIPAEEQWPIVTTSKAMTFHKASGAAWNRQDQWLDLQMVEDNFGILNSLEDVNWASQYLQAEGIRYIIEECRRKQPNCSGVFIWAVNETWPNAASLSLMDYDFGRRQAYYAMQKAFSKNIVSVRYEDLLYNDAVRCELWLDAEQAGVYTVSVDFCTADGRHICKRILQDVRSDGMPVKLEDFQVEAEGVVFCYVELSGIDTNYKNTYCWGQKHQYAPFAEILP